MGLRRGYILIFLWLLIGMVVQSRWCSAAEKEEAEQSTKGREATWTITARDSLIYQEEEGLYQAKGNVTFEKEDQTIYADEATYNTRTGLARVKGNVRFEWAEGVMTADEGEFDLKNQTGYVVNGQIFIEENNYYLSGRLIERISEDTYVIKDCRLTTCDGLNPDWSITASDVRVTLEDIGRARKASFRVRDFPIFYLPYLVFPVKTERQTGFLAPRLGYSSLNGLDMELPFFWAISDQFDATFYERYMSRRGLMQGVEFRYAAQNDSRGLLLFDLLPDNIKEKDMTNPEELSLSPMPRSNSWRYWLRGRADQQMPFGFRARLDLDLVSDQDYLREFQGGLFGFEARPDMGRDWNRPLEEIHSPFRRSALRLSHEQPDYSLQTLFSYYDRPEEIVQDQTPQPVSGFDFTYLPRLLTHHWPLYFSFDTDYDYIWRDFGQRGHRLLANPKVTLPMRLSPYLSFEPSLGLTHHTAWLDDELEGEDRWQRSNALRFEARLSTLLERIYDLNWQSAGRLKHKILPSLYFQHQHYDKKGGTLPWFEPLEEEGKINRLVFSLENFLDARLERPDRDVRYFQWATLSFVQGYDIDEAKREEDSLRPREPFEPLIGKLGLSPHENLKLKAESHWNHYQKDIDGVDLSLDFRLDRSGNRKDSIAIDYIIQKDERKTLQASLAVNLWPKVSVGTHMTRDISAGRDISTGYWVDYASQCWGVRLSAGSVGDISGFMLSFRLAGIGSGAEW